MAPIKVGLIGLSKGGWARFAHLPFLKHSDKYQIVAVQNSSMKSAEEAVAAYELGSDVKCYGDPEDLAKDSNVDLVVCSVRVDRHNTTISPSLKAGKDVYVEWPLGKDLADAEALLELKNTHNVKHAVVGLQARQSPLVTKVATLISDGTIGDVLSVEWHAHAIHMGATMLKGMEYFADESIGGNITTIHLGHGVDFVQHALGSYFKLDSVRSTLANRRSTIPLVGEDGKVLDPAVPKTTNDTLFISATTESGIPVSLTMRGGEPFKGTPGLDWRILGTEGEIRVTASGPFLQIGYPDQKIELSKGGEVSEVAYADEWEELPVPARNVARVYEGIAGAAGKREKLCSFEDAVERHRFLNALGK